MKHFYLKSIVMTIVFLSSVLVSAYDFKVDDIYYNVLSEDDATCEVTGNGSVFGSAYSGDVVIPSSVTNEGKTYTVTTIGYESFYWCSGLSSVSIPATVTTINSSAFSLSSTLRTIYNYAATPQAISSSTFDYASLMTIHVYKGCKSAYANATGWSSCKIVEDMEPTLVTSITIENKNITCYPYEGTKVSYSIAPADASIKDLDWTSSDENTLHIESDGTLVGVKAGSATVTATAKDGSGVSATFNVNVGETRGGGSYKAYLSSSNTSASISSIGSFYTKTQGFNLKNNGSDYIYVTKLIIKNVNEDYSTITSTTDTSLLGWLGAGNAIGLSYKLYSNTLICYEWHYTYKGEEYIFCSDSDDPSAIELPTIDESKIEVARYTVDGKKITNKVSGINIVKYNDGTTRKVFVK